MKSKNQSKKLSARIAAWAKTLCDLSRGNSGILPSRGLVFRLWNNGETMIPTSNQAISQQSRT